MQPMAEDQLSQATAERRCPNCGTRVARDAETCFMCGNDLRVRPQRRQRVSWVDALLVLAVLAVLGIWWRLGNQSQPEEAAPQTVQALLPTNVPRLSPTGTVTPTVEPTVTPVLPTPAPNYTVHVVRRGETLLAIAGTYGVTVEEIQAANNLSGVLIRAGDELIIPSKEPAAQARPTGEVSNFQYTVKSGDTIISIALQFGSSVQEILAANGLRENQPIYPGDVLTVPVRQVPPEVLEGSPAGEPTRPPDVNGLNLGPASTIYIEPRLIGPPDGATLPRTEPALLRWISVDVLDPNEWYVLLLYPVSAGAQQVPSIWTKATSYRLDPSFAPAEGESADYAWQVSVVRVKPGAGAAPTLEAASPSSELRRFSWR